MELTRSISDLKVNNFVFDCDSSLFHSKQFFQQNARENDVFLELKTSKNNGIVCYFNEIEKGVWASPGKGTFASPLLVGKVSDSEYFETLKLFEAYLCSRGAKEIQYLLPPFYCSSSSVSLTHYFLQNLGYSNFRTDLNYHIEIFDKPFAQTISSSKRNGLRKAAMNDVNTIQLENSYFDRVYSLLQKNRKSLGTKLSMSREQLQTLVQSFPKKITMVGTFLEEKLVSAAFCLRITTKTLYVFYWGHDPDCNLQNPILPLAEFLYQYCHKQGISFLDLGTSTIASNPNWKLMFFKNSLGASATLKCRFRKKLE